MQLDCTLIVKIIKKLDRPVRRRPDCREAALPGKVPAADKGRARPG